MQNKLIQKRLKSKKEISLMFTSGKFLFSGNPLDFLRRVVYDFNLLHKVEKK